MASGNSAQIGWSIETTAGTIVAPTVFNPMLEGESLTIEPSVLKSGAIIAGRRFHTSDQVNGGNVVIGGDIPLELYNRNLGKLFRGMLGAVNTTGSGPYTHVFTSGDLADDTLTVQVGLPAVGGTVHPKTLGGCAIASWEIAGNAGEIVTLGATVAAMNGHVGSRVVTDGVLNSTTLVTSATAVFTQGDVGKPIAATGIPAGTTIASVTSATNIVLSAAASATATGVTVTIGTALASASYASSQYPMKFSKGTLSMFGSSIANCMAFTIAGDNALASERYFMSRYPALAIEAGIREYTGTVDLEFDSLTQLDRMAAGTEGALSLVLTAANGDTATIAGNIHFQPFTPTVSGRELLMQSIPFDFVASGADSTAITITLVNSDSAA